jgi:hypothetical protein
MTTGTIVDCERHALVERLEDLLPYLDETWVHRLTSGEFVLPPASPHPGVELEGHAVDGGASAEAAASSLGP